VALEQMRREGVAQGMRRDPRAETGSLGGHLARSVELPRRQRAQRILARKQPALGAALQPSRAQEFEQLRRQHRMAILAAIVPEARL
jgi:hypothetical protein